MKFASLSDIRKELQLLPPKRLQELCLRIAKYKKENKDLLAFLLFEDDNRHVFIEELKSEIDGELAVLTAQGNLYYMKKSLRRILRSLHRYIRFIDDNAQSAELIIWFCGKLREYKLPLSQSAQLRNLYGQQVSKAEKLIGSLHEDVQQDFLSELQNVRIL